MKITDVKSATIGTNICIRIVTDKGIDGFSQIENNKDFVKPLIPYFKSMIVGADPTNVEDCMRRMRRAGAFKPWGKVISSIEMALWDIAGKDAGVPVYKLLGGKVRDRVRVYQGSFVSESRPHKDPKTPEEIAENILHLNEIPEGFTIAKTALFWHRGGFYKETDAYNTYYPPKSSNARFNPGSLLTSEAINMSIDFVARMKKVVGDRVGLAFDSGPGFTPIDALRLARGVEPYNVMWLEDTIAGDYTPYTMAHAYRDLTMQTTTPIHTGEQIFLRQNFVELIEKQAVNIVGPDPADVGGIAELKWIAEYADLHGIMMAPHGTFDGVFGMAALTQVGATMPQNYIAYEYPFGNPSWWYDIVEGLPTNFLRDGHVTVWDAPGIGVTFNVNKASKYLSEEDKDFFLG
ncbi:MAG: mandelate racemase/muconate lactonizing enzyme family protein [Christensenellaceae bacterium]|jgi:L-alanine-DL-glutamate epimerase-like enolase superfamily enzyme|nr:mandelate racemase/muconate lactonizing enzyme family protein [Christensenellaceae bacterium]